LKSIITPLKESNSELLDVVNSTSKALDDERSFRDKEIIEMKKTNAQLVDLVECMTQKLDDETAKYEENVTNMRKMMKIQKEDNTALVQSLQMETKSLATQLRISKDESDIFKEEIRIMSKDIVELTTKYNTTVTQNEMYMKQLELSNTECSKLKAAIEDLESKIVNGANEVQNLSIALDDANNHFISVSEELGQVRTTSNKKITELQDALKSMAKLLSDERTSHDKQLDEMKKVFYNLNRMHEESLGDVTTKNFELKKTITDLTKSHDEAMVELEKKATEIQTYVDLKAQLESECVVGGAFWRMK
jgi:chromosome segregation ATPase